MPLPAETCQVCGKSISREAIANIWNGEKVVCTSCYRKLDRQKREREAREAAGCSSGPSGAAYPAPRGCRHRPWTACAADERWVSTRTVLVVRDSHTEPSAPGHVRS